MRNGERAERRKKCAGDEKLERKYRIKKIRVSVTPEKAGAKHGAKALGFYNEILTSELSL